MKILNKAAGVVIFAIGITLTATSCFNRTPKNNDKSYGITDPTMLSTKSFFFAGEIVCIDDQMVMNDCVTGAVFPVADNDVSTLVKREYSSLTSGNNNVPLYARVEGFVRPLEKGAGKTLTITKFQGFDSMNRCSSAHRLTGRYLDRVGDTAVRQISIDLEPDYTFRQITRDVPSGNYGVTEGRWWRLNESVMVFITPGNNDLLATLDWSSMEIRFSENSAFLKK